MKKAYSSFDLHDRVQRKRLLRNSSVLRAMGSGTAGELGTYHRAPETSRSRELILSDFRLTDLEELLAYVTTLEDDLERERQRALELADECVRLVAVVPDEELAAMYREDGEDPVEVANRTRRVIEAAIREQE